MVEIFMEVVEMFSLAILCIVLRSEFVESRNIFSPSILFSHAKTIKTSIELNKFISLSLYNFLVCMNLIHELNFPFHWEILSHPYFLIFYHFFYILRPKLLVNLM